MAGKCDLLVILDPGFGERLRSCRGQPVWIVKSPANDPTIRALWEEDQDAGRSYLEGVTGISEWQGMSSQECFLRYFDDIDLHHGRHSTSEPYLTITVLGARLTEQIESELRSYGFHTFSRIEGGFWAERDQEQANKYRV